MTISPTSTTSPKASKSLKTKLGSGLVGLLVLSGAVGVAAPAAFAQDTETTQEHVDSRLDRLAEAVASGRLTQDQADEIADRIASGEFVGRANRGNRGNRGAGLDTVAEVIGVDADTIRAGFEEGLTLTQIAEANGVSADALTDALIAAATEHINAHVADGTIDADTAAEKLAGLEERITERINQDPTERGTRGDGEGRGNGNGRRGPRNSAETSETGEA